MRKILRLLVAAVIGSYCVAVVAEVTGAAGISSDYVRRGISQTDNQVAISVEVESTFKNGLYFGAWGSNVNFQPDDPSVELDLYGGYTSQLAYGVNYDLGVIHYEYPGAGQFETQEVYAGLGYEKGVLTCNYTNDYFGSDQSAWYLGIGTGLALPAEFELQLHIGRSDGDHFDQAGFNPYTDYKIGVSRYFDRFLVDLSYTDTDLSSEECTVTGDACDGRAIATIKMDF